MSRYASIVRGRTPVAYTGSDSVVMALTSDAHKDKEPDFKAQVKRGECWRRSRLGRNWREDRTIGCRIVEERAGQPGVPQEGRRPLLLGHAAVRAEDVPPLAGERLFVQRWFEPFAGGGQATSSTPATSLVGCGCGWGRNQERSWAAFEVPLPRPGAVDTSLGDDGEAAALGGRRRQGVGYDAEGEGEGESGSAMKTSGAAPGRTVWSPFNTRDARLEGVCSRPPAALACTPTASSPRHTPGTYVMTPAARADVRARVWGRSEGGRSGRAGDKFLDDEETMSRDLRLLWRGLWRRRVGFDAPDRQARRVGQDPRRGGAQQQIYTSSRAARSTRRCRHRRVEAAGKPSSANTRFMVGTNDALYTIETWARCTRSTRRRLVEAARQGGRVSGPSRSVHEAHVTSSATARCTYRPVERLWKPVGKPEFSDTVALISRVERSTPSSARGSLYQVNRNGSWKQSARPTTGPAPSARHLKGRSTRRDRRRAVRHRAQHRRLEAARQAGVRRDAFIWGAGNKLYSVERTGACTRSTRSGVERIPLPSERVAEAGRGNGLAVRSSRLPRGARLCLGINKPLTERSSSSSAVARPAAGTRKER